MDILTGSSLEEFKAEQKHITLIYFFVVFFFKVSCINKKMYTFISAAAALRLMIATDSRLRRRGSRLRAERELENEQRDAVPGVKGVCGALKPSTSSTLRKARPRARGSTICTQTHHSTSYKCVGSPRPFLMLGCQDKQNRQLQGCT